MMISKVKRKQILRLFMIFFLICIVCRFMYAEKVSYQELRYSYNTFNFFTRLFFVLNAIAWSLALLITYQPLIELREYIKIRKRDKYRSYVISQYIFSILVLFIINVGLDFLLDQAFYLDSILLSVFGSLLTIITLHLSKFQSKGVFAILIGMILMLLL